MRDIRRIEAKIIIWNNKACELDIYLYEVMRETHEIGCNKIKISGEDISKIIGNFLPENQFEYRKNKGTQKGILCFRTK
jgi:hypothetical protein